MRIDDLFGITDDDELERVDFLLEHEKITAENFVYSKKVPTFVVNKSTFGAN